MSSQKRTRLSTQSSLASGRRTASAKTSCSLNENTPFKVLESWTSYKLNADHSALFRTSYSPERLTKLGEAARAGLLTVEDRAGMIADAGALASSGYGKTSGLLSLLKSFDSETSYVVWNEILSRLNAVRSAWIFEDEEIKVASEGVPARSLR